MGISSINEKSAQFTSKILVWVAFCVTLIYVMYMIKNVDETPYPYIASILLAYLGVGDLIMMSKAIFPRSSRKMLKGNFDLHWGIKHLYWSFWWPLYLKS